MSKKNASQIIGGIAIIAFCLGLYIDDFSLNNSPELKMGKYVWDYDKIVARMDQELIIRTDSGSFVNDKAYLDPTWFKIDGDQFVFNDTISLKWYTTADGIGVMWTPGIHQMWKYVEK